MTGAHGGAPRRAGSALLQGLPAEGAVLAGANLAGLDFGIWGGSRRRMEVPKGCLKGADLKRADYNPRIMPDTEMAAL